MVNAATKNVVAPIVVEVRVTSRLSSGKSKSDGNTSAELVDP